MKINRNDFNPEQIGEFQSNSIKSRIRIRIITSLKLDTSIKIGRLQRKQKKSDTKKLDLFENTKKHSKYTKI